MVVYHWVSARARVELVETAAAEPAPAVGVGGAMLLWWPSLSNTGYFLSEAPFLCFQLWSTLGLVVVLQEGKGALPAGLAPGRLSTSRSGTKESAPERHIARLEAVVEDGRTAVEAARRGGVVPDHFGGGFPGR